MRFRVKIKVEEENLPREVKYQSLKSMTIQVRKSVIST